MISSLGNAQVKNVISLNTRTKERRRQDLFVAEGLKMFLEAPRSCIVKVFVSENFYKREDCMDLLGQADYEVVSAEVFDRMSDTKTPQGILTVLRQLHYVPENLTGSSCPLLLILEGIQDPGNLGTMVRTAEGAGVSGILMDRGTVDIYNPKVIRSTMGSIYRMPFLYSEDLRKEIRHLKEQGIKIYAAHLGGDVLFTRKDYGGASAFLIGNEGNGLTEETAACADECIKIPMSGRVESLNAAVAASLLMYEADRQRRETDRI